MIAMKIRCISALILAIAFSAKAGLVIVQEVKQSGPMPLDTQMTIKTEGDKIRVDVGKEISSIVDSESGSVSSLMHSQKIAMQLPKGALDAIKKKASAEKSAGGPDIKPTGKKETINGFKCEEYAGTYQGLQVSYWVTQDVENAKTVMAQLSKLSGEADPFKGALKDGTDFPGFPIRTVVKSPQMGESTMTIVSINDEEIPEKEFEVPADYKSMSMPQMQGQSQGAPSIPVAPETN